MGYKRGNKGARWIRRSRHKNAFDVPHAATASTPLSATTSGFGSSGTEGMLIYDESTDTLKFNNGSDWYELASSSTSTADGVYNAGGWSVAVDTSKANPISGFIPYALVLAPRKPNSS